MFVHAYIETVLQYVHVQVDSQVLQDQLPMPSLFCTTKMTNLLTNFHQANTWLCYVLYELPLGIMLIYFFKFKSAFSFIYAYYIILFLTQNILCQNLNFVSNERIFLIVTILVPLMLQLSNTQNASLFLHNYVSHLVFGEATLLPEYYNFFTVQKGLDFGESSYFRKTTHYQPLNSPKLRLSKIWQHFADKKYKASGNKPN